jgi:hypothetical protein
MGPNGQIVGGAQRSTAPTLTIHTSDRITMVICERGMPNASYTSSVPNDPFEATLGMISFCQPR